MWLVKRNLAYYWRTNLVVVFGVATAVAVLAGALLVGDSVRASLRELFLQRVGNADQVVTAAGFFREKLADELQAHTLFASQGFTNACPLIVLDGTVTEQESGRRAGNVQVYGVDERFWKFHGRVETKAPGTREILLSASLADELGAKRGTNLLLRVEKPSTIPVESLHGRKEDLGRTLPLTAREVLPASSLGEFSVRPQQSGVRAVFVPLALLQKELELQGKVNTLLVSERGPEDSTKSVALEKILKDKLALEDMGIKLRALTEQRSLSLESDSALVNDSLAEVARDVAGKSKMRSASVLSYLANAIRAAEREIPYSLVTAIDDESFENLRRGDATTQRTVDTQRATGEQQNPAPGPRPPAPILLNEWAARDLGVKPGDSITLEYYLWQVNGQLIIKDAQFQLAGIVPIKGAAADRELVPAYPGITGTESLSDWDPPFPVNLERIRKKDEDYWDEFRTTPKAFITLARGQELWQTRFGRLTSLRFAPADGADLQTSLEAYRQNLRDRLDPAQVGFVVYPAKAQGLAASRGATDFGEYFLYFSFFLVVSALLLTALFFKLGIEQRLREIGTLQAVGFPPAKIRALFLGEGIVLAMLGSLVGLAGALLYGKLMMLGLSTWWIGAVGTTMLKLKVSPVSLLIGFVGGILAALLCIVWTLRRLATRSTRSLLSGNPEAGQSTASLSTAPAKRLFNASRVSIVAGLLGLLFLLAAAVGWTGNLAGFFGGGTLLLVALLAYQSAWLGRRGRNFIHGNNLWSVSKLGFRNATHRPGRSILCIALIASAAFIIVAVDAFRRSDKETTLDKSSGSGGYPLLAESVLPLVHDPNTPDGREALNLFGGQEAGALDGVRFTRFRVRPGDDASCLNLYQPKNPRIIAPVEDFLSSGRFSFQESLATNELEKTNPWLLLQSDLGEGTIPVIADANSMTYVLRLKLGDELVLNRSGNAPPVRLRIVGALSDSIFQSELLMSEKNFLRLFPEQEGYRFFLMDVPSSARTDEVARVLEDNLSDFGFDVVPTAERLANFHRVENTFISTFQMLGALGLVLGTLGLAAVLLRNVLERRKELALLRAVGYNSSALALMVVAESSLLLAGGLLTGTLCALLAIAPLLVSRGGRASILSLGLLLLAVVASGMVASLVATISVLRAPLLPALRAE
jgi:putative ABC transport system permease protein